MKWKPSYKFYRGSYRIARVLLGVFFRFEFKGNENVPSGAAMICSNHSSVTDPIIMAFAFGIDCWLHFLAKIELFKAPVISLIVKKLGAVSVNRNMTDITTIKRTLEYFRNGEKVAIFPEGTRASEADYIEAKSGAVRIAERAGVPLVPVFVPRKKRIFRKAVVVIGEPYFIEKQSGKRSADDYARLSEELMNRIEALNTESRKAAI